MASPPGSFPSGSSGLGTSYQEQVRVSPGTTLILVVPSSPIVAKVAGWVVVAVAPPVGAGGEMLYQTQSTYWPPEHL